jgi:4-amino-4-deoxy-L-arabinose transferase-like glycosyltransferase
VLLLLCVGLPKIGQGDFNVDTGAYSAYALQAFRAAAAGDAGWLWTLRGVGGDPLTGEVGGGVPGGGTFYFNKPPLAFWVHGALLYAAGPSLWAARLPSLLAAALTVVATMGLVRAAGGRRLALLTGFVLALTPEFFRYARAFSLDLWLTLFLVLSLWGVVVAVRACDYGRGRVGAGWFVLAGCALGGGLLVKPFVALVGVGLVVVWLVATRRAMAAAMAPLVLLGALVVAGPWHVSMWWLHGEAFTGQYFGNQVVERAKGNLSDNPGAGQPWYYLRVMAESHWPWLPVLGVGVWAWWRGEGRVAAWRGGTALAVVWVVGWLVLLSMFADKRPRYVVVAQPCAAWLCALGLLHARGVLGAAAGRALGVGARVLERWGLPIAAVVGVAVAASPLRVHKGPPPEWADAIELLRSAGRGNVWEAGAPPMASARVYLALGWWPRPSVGYDQRPIAEPPAGALLLHQPGGKWGPPGEPAGEEVYRRGEVLLVRRAGP